MARYEVRWFIDIEAESPQIAAQQALQIQRDSESTATVFEVIDNRTKRISVIDLENENEDSKNYSTETRK